MPEPLFEPAKMLEALARHRVEYVLIGGLAATLHGSPAVTNDADICPARTPQNLTRLAEALREIEVRARTDAEPRGLPFACDAEFLSRMRVVNLVTAYGTFDIAFEPAGFDGYDELVVHSVELAVGNLTVRVASLADVIRSKEAANRPKDHATLPILYALQDEIAKREQT